MSNDFFGNPLDVGAEWKALSDGFFEGCDRAAGEVNCPALASTVWCRAGVYS